MSLILSIYVVQEKQRLFQYTSGTCITNGYIQVYLPPTQVHLIAWLSQDLQLKISVKFNKVF